MNKMNLGVAVFDFDWSLAEEDSDNWTFSHLAPELWEQEQKKGTQWTDMVDGLLCKMQDEQGVTIADITNTLKDLPFSLPMTQVLKDLKRRNVPVIILSDANEFFIETVLNFNGVRDCITEIITNPAYIDEKGRLRVRRFLKSTEIHNCENPCTVNICKGRELEKIITKYGPLEKIAYTGDGANDFCPGTRLRQHDMYFLREGKSLDDYLKLDPVRETKFICQKTRWIEPATVWKHMPVFFS